MKRARRGQGGAGGQGQDSPSLSAGFTPNHNHETTPPHHNANLATNKAIEIRPLCAQRSTSRTRGDPETIGLVHVFARPAPAGEISARLLAPPPPPLRRGGAERTPRRKRRSSTNGAPARLNHKMAPPLATSAPLPRFRSRPVLLALLAIITTTILPPPATAASVFSRSQPAAVIAAPPLKQDTEGDTLAYSVDERSANATGGRWLETLAWSPRAFLMHRFVSDAEADHLIAIARPHMRASQIVDSKTGKLFASDARTSKGHFLQRGQDEVVARVERRIAAWTKLPPENGETLHILEYGVSEQYRPHFDTFTDAVNVKRGGQRVATVLVYLETPTRGGETIFPDAEPRSLEPSAAAHLDALTDAGELSACAADAPLAVKPRKGDALLFYSLTPEGEPDSTSLHASCPVEEGTKWSATRWIRLEAFN